MELLRSLSPGEVLPDLSSVRNSLVSATDDAKVQSEGQGELWEGFNLLVCRGVFSGGARGAMAPLMIWDLKEKN